MDALQEEYGPKGLKVVTVNLTNKDSEKKALAVKKQRAKSLTVLMDVEGKVSRAYFTGTVYPPLNVLIDTEGNIVYRGWRVPEKEMEDMFAAIQP